MAIDVSITVKNLQYQDEQKNIIHQQTRGYLYPKKQAVFLQYEEDSEGLKGVKTTLKLEKERVTLIRHGKVSMNQTFEKGLKHEGGYQTPYGNIPLITDTTDIEIAIGQDEGLIRIFYNLYLAEDLSSNNTLEIAYQKMDSRIE